ncbi:MAG: hypothetical protein AB1758_03130 [Candidatus Eremiobacterota bacterium]
MRTAVSELEALVAEGDLLELGVRASRARTHDGVGFLEDGAVLLARPGVELPERPPWPRMIHLASDSAEYLLELRARYPGVWVHGPAGLPVDSLALFTSREPQERLPEVATVLYDQESSVLDDLERLARRPRLVGVVLLPAAVGDQVLVEGATTWGNRDVSLLAAARILLPHCHVRASWGALGWKLAQPAVAFGADELAGWGLEEHLAYPRARPASGVGRAEVEAGIREAGRIPVEVSRCDWAS